LSEIKEQKKQQQKTTTMCEKRNGLTRQRVICHTVHIITSSVYFSHN
jgi:hypothetical protein